jgi:MFS family permease
LKSDRRSLGVLLSATFLSLSGDAITQLGVPWLVLLDTGSAEKAGLVAVCTMLPSAASALLGGAVVDRVGARRVSVLSDMACCLTLAAIPVLQLAGLLHFWELCCLMAATGLLHAPGDTARAVLLPALADRSDVSLSRSVGWFAGTSRAASIVGAAAGGVLITSLGAAHVLFIDSGTFAASALLIAFGIPRPDPERPGLRAHRGHTRTVRGYRRDLRDGVRLVVTTPLVLGITVLTLIAQTLDQGWSAVILPVDVRDKLHSVLVLGTAETGFAVGALAGAVVYSTLADRLPRWLVFTLGFIIVGMPRFAVAALTATPAPLIAMMTVEGLACGPLNPITSNVIYQLAPEQMRGRVIGSMTAITLLTTPFGGLAAGALIGSLGLAATTAVFGGSYLIVTLIPAVVPLYRQISDPLARR